MDNIMIHKNRQTIPQRLVQGTDQDRGHFLSLPPHRSTPSLFLIIKRCSRLVIRENFPSFAQ